MGGIIYESDLNKRCARFPRSPITVKPKEASKKKERRGRGGEEEEREGKENKETERRNYAPLLMKQSPLRPCYLDVRARGAPASCSLALGENASSLVATIKSTE